MLYALAIHRNLVSIIMLVKAGFNLLFKKDGVDTFLEHIKYGTGYVFYGFIMLDVEQTSNNNNVCFSLFTSSVDDMNIWHTWLVHTGQND